MALEMKRNEERFRFVKWAMQAYKGIRLMPPGWGILHQLNLEFLAPGFLEKDGVCYPGHARRHRLAHVHDRRARRGRLGRGRHRSRSGGARPAGLFPDARRGRRARDRRVEARRHGDRPRAHRDRNAAPGESRRQVRRVLRRGREEPDAAGPRDDFEHGGRVRRDDRLFPGRRADVQISGADRTRRRARARSREVLSRARLFRRRTRRRSRLHPRDRARPCERHAERRGTEAPAGPHCAAGHQKPLRKRAHRIGRERRLWQRRGAIESEWRAGRSRRRRHRCDHLLHEHFEPGRHARCRSGREKSGRARAACETVGKNVAHAGFHRRQQISRGGRPAALSRQAGICRRGL